MITNILVEHAYDEGCGGAKSKGVNNLKGGVMKLSRFWMVRTSIFVLRLLFEEQTTSSKIVRPPVRLAERILDFLTFPTQNRQGLSTTVVSLLTVHNLK